MNYTVQELALQYAEAMVRFYQANDQFYATVGEAVDEAYKNLVVCRDAMYDSQERLAAAAKRQAELLNAE